MPTPNWFEQPATGNDVADRGYLLDAFNALDSISPGHRTDAFRALAVRYQRDLRRMAEERTTRPDPKRDDPSP